MRRSDFFYGLTTVADGEIHSTIGVTDPICYFEYCGAEYKIRGAVDPDDIDTIYTVTLDRSRTDDIGMLYFRVASFPGELPGHLYLSWLAKTLLDQT